MKATVDFNVEGVGDFSASTRLDQVDKIQIEFLKDELFKGADLRLKHEMNLYSLQSDLGISEDFYKLSIDKRREKIMALFSSPDVTIRSKTVILSEIQDRINYLYHLAELKIAFTKKPAGVELRQLDDEVFKSIWEAYLKAVSPFRPKKKRDSAPHTTPESKGVSENGGSDDDRGETGGGGTPDTVQDEIRPPDNRPEI